MDDVEIRRHSPDGRRVVFAGIKTLRRDTMEFLNKLVRFVLMQIAALGFMLIAPVLYLIPFVFIVLTPNNDIIPMLAVAMMMSGPFVSAFWTMIVCMVRRYRRITADGDPYEPSLGGMFVATGWMLYGFFGTVVTELLFMFTVHSLGNLRGPNPWGWALWFAAAPFVIFSPLLLVWAWRKLVKGQSVTKLA
jgi:hypothetical protein